MPRRRALVVAAVAVLLAIAGVMLRQRASSPELTTPDQLPGKQPTSVRRALAMSPARAANAAATAPGQRLARTTAEDLRRRARYPRSAQPIGSNAEDPIVREYTVSRNSFPGPNGEDPALTAFPEQISFEPRDAIALYAYLSAGGNRVRAQSIEAEVIDPQGRGLARLVFADDGIDPDRSAGDLVYSARVPTTAGEQLAGGPYTVRVHAVSADGQDRIGSTGFLFSRPAAELTGHYTDALIDGNLELQAELEVHQAGRFHLEGTLYTQSGTALAWAQNALTLDTGTQWIPLSFFGLILREHGEDGPYVLRFAALSTTTAMPNAKNRLVENAYVTAPYQASDFSDQPYNDPNLLDAAQRLERVAGAAAASSADESP